MQIVVMQLAAIKKFSTAVSGANKAYMDTISEELKLINI